MAEIQIYKSNPIVQILSSTNAGGGGGVSLVDGSGTTFNVNKIDLGGTLTSDVLIIDPLVAYNFSIGAAGDGSNDPISIQLSSPTITFYNSPSSQAFIMQGHGLEDVNTIPASYTGFSLVNRNYTLGAKTYTDKQTFFTGTTSASSINIPNGVAPTVPANGDLWGASNHLFARLNGVTYQLDQPSVLPTLGGANTILGVNNSGLALEYKTVSNGLNVSGGSILKLGGDLVDASTTLAPATDNTNSLYLGRNAGFSKSLSTLDIASYNTTIGGLSTAQLYYGASANTKLTLSASGYISAVDAGLPFTFTQAAGTGAVATAFTFNAGAHTALSAGAELPNYIFSNVTQQWATGGLALQRHAWFKSPTIAFVGASTVTTAYTVYIEASTAGTNASITNNFALGVIGRSNFSNNISVAGGVSIVSGDLITSNSNTVLTKGAQSSVWAPTLKVLPGANTGQTAATEFPDYVIGGASGDANTAVSTRTSTWLAGTVATQRGLYIKGTVLTGASATATFTNAYTLYIDPPTVGANAAITNNWALGVNGNATFSGRVVTTSTATLPAFNMVGVSGNPSTTVAGDMWYETGTGVFRIRPGATIVNIMGAAANSPVASVPFANAVTNQYTFATGFTYSTTTGLAVAHGGLTITQAAASSAWQPALSVTPGAHTGMTATTEFPDYVIFGSTKTWASAGGAFTQRFNWFKGSTIATATGADAYTIYVDAPSGGATNWALGLNGKVKFVSAPTNDNAQVNLLTYDGTSGEVKYRTVASLPASTIQTATITLSNGQIASGNTAPVSLIPAQGAGKVIQVISALTKIVFGSAAWATNTNYRYQYNGAASGISSVMTFNQASTTYQFEDVTQGISNATPASIENKGIEWFVQTGNPTGGTGGTIVIQLEYIVKTL